KKSPFTAGDIAQLRAAADRLRFEVLYAPPHEESDAAWAADDHTAPAASFTRPAQDVIVDGASTGDYARLIRAPDRERFYAAYRFDVRPTTDDRPFFFHTTKLANQFDVAFGRSMLFGNGLSALMTLLAISTALVALFVVGPLAIVDRGRTGVR